MAGTIAVSPEQLRTQAQVYIKAQQGIQAQLQAVNNMNGQIQQEWKGEAFNAYMNQYSQLATEVKKFEELLTNINKQLNSYADSMAQNDAQQAKGFGLQ